MDDERLRRSAGSWSCSLLAHALALAAFLAIPAALPPKPSPPAHYIATLIPILTRDVAPPALQPRPVRLPPIQPTRAFTAPAPRPATPISAEPQKFAMEAPPVPIALPKPEFVPPPASPRRRTPASPRPTIWPPSSLKARSLPGPAPVVQASGFTNAQSVAPSAPRPAVSNVGAFNSATTTETAPRTAGISTGAFGQTAARETPVRHDAVSKGAFGDTVVGPATRAAQASVAAVEDAAVEIVSETAPGVYRRGGA